MRLNTKKKKKTHFRFEEEQEKPHFRLKEEHERLDYRFEEENEKRDVTSDKGLNPEFTDTKQEY